MIPADVVWKMQVAILNGVKKVQFRPRLDLEQSEFWDKLAAEITSMPANVVVDIEDEWYIPPFNPALKLVE